MVREILDEDLGDSDSLAAEGWHHVEVKDCREKQSARGDAYYNLELVEADTKKLVAYDICMLEGRGIGIGCKKLCALGAATRNVTGTGWILEPPRSVVGLRVFVHIFHEDQEWNGERRRRAAVSLKKGECGYRSEGDPPDDFTPF